jgi:hypothetical protein
MAMNVGLVGLGLIGGSAAKAYKAALQPLQLIKYLVTTANLLTEMDYLINSLHEYRDAIVAGDADSLRSLLRDGRIIKRAN